MARNDIDESMMISRHLRLGIVSEIEYNNCYLVVLEAADLVLALASMKKEGF